jgi:hypothetical protein
MARHDARWSGKLPRLMGWLARSGRAVATVLRDPVIVIFLLAGVAEILAGDPLVDWLVLLTVAAALSWDRIRRRQPADGEAVGKPDPRRMVAGVRPGMAVDAGAVAQPGQGWVGRLVPARHNRAWAIGGLLYAVAAGGLARFSWPALVAVAGPGLVGMLSAWRTQPSPSVEAAPIHARGVAAWAVVFVVLALWELGALLLQPALTIDSPAHPTISVLLDPVLESYLGRSVGFAVWLALGWFLVRQ